MKLLPWIFGMGECVPCEMPVCLAVGLPASNKRYINQSEFEKHRVQTAVERDKRVRFQPIDARTSI